jgi:hypothetical protein
MNRSGIRTQVSTIAGGAIEDIDLSREIFGVNHQMA